jgi:hypothetical protein
VQRKKAERAKQKLIEDEARQKIEDNGGNFESENSMRRQASGRSTAPLINNEKKINALVDLPTQTNDFITMGNGLVSGPISARDKIVMSESDFSDKHNFENHHTDVKKFLHDL